MLSLALRDSPKIVINAESDHYDMYQDRYGKTMDGRRGYGFCNLYFDKNDKQKSRASVKQVKSIRVHHGAKAFLFTHCQVLPPHWLSLLRACARAHTLSHQHMNRVGTKRPQPRVSSSTVRTSRDKISLKARLPRSYEALWFLAPRLGL